MIRAVRQANPKSFVHYPITLGIFRHRRQIFDRNRKITPRPNHFNDIFLMLRRGDALVICHVAGFGLRLRAREITYDRPNEMETVLC